MYFTNITYHMVPKYTKDNLVKDYLFSDSRDKKWFLTESQANTAVRKYLDKVPTAILNAFQKEDWHIIVTNENVTSPICKPLSSPLAPINAGTLVSVPLSTTAITIVTINIIL